jgi:hypothetical protein
MVLPLETRLGGAPAYIRAAKRKNTHSQTRPIAGYGVFRLEDGTGIIGAG